MCIKKNLLIAFSFTVLFPGLAMSSDQDLLGFYKSHPDEAKVRQQYCDELTIHSLTSGSFDDYRKWQTDPDCKNAREAMKFLAAQEKRNKNEVVVKQYLTMSYEQRYEFYKELQTIDGMFKNGNMRKRDALIEANQRLRKDWLQKFRDNPDLLSETIKQCDPVINERLRTIYLDSDAPGECQAVEDYQRETGAKVDPKPLWGLFGD